jgi:hypothetical protein
MFHTPRLFGTTALVLAVMALPLRADNTNDVLTNPLQRLAAKAAPSFDPRVRDLLDSIGRYYAGLNSFQVDISSTEKAEVTGVKTELTSTLVCGMSRPNSFAINIQTGGMAGSAVLSDGTKYICYMALLKEYTSQKAPEYFSDLFDTIKASPTTMMMIGGLPLSFEQLLAPNLTRAYLRGATHATYMGPEKVGDITTQRIQIQTPPYMIDLWFSEDSVPLLVQTQVKMDMQTMKNAVSLLSAADKAKMPFDILSMKTEELNTFSNWRVNQPVPASFFAFHLPPNSKLVTTFDTSLPIPVFGSAALATPVPTPSPATNSAPPAPLSGTD